MKCNSCWRTLEGRAVATTCGHVFCTEDASRILSSDSTCPLCESLLSKSNMKAVDMNLGDEWCNMSMAGVAPNMIMKSAFKGVVFWIGQKDVENQVTVNKAMALKQKCEEMQSKYMEKLEQVHAAYQKAMKKVQALEHEKDQLVKDKNELQEKYTEKSRQKRKLEEMYDALRNEYEQLKRGGGHANQALAPLQPRDRNAMMARPPQYNFGPSNSFDELPQKTRPTQGLLDLPARRNSATSGHNQGFFDMPPPPRQRASPGPGAGLGTGLGTSIANLNRPRSLSPLRGGDPNGSLFTPANGNPSNNLRNLLLSPMTRRPTSRLRTGGLRSTAYDPVNTM